MSIFWPDKPAREIARLFASEPDQWTADDHHATHKRTGLKIWIANGSFALEARTPFSPRLYGFFFPVGTASQIHIWNAFKRWRRGAVSRAIAKTGASA